MRSRLTMPKKLKGRADQYASEQVNNRKGIAIRNFTKVVLHCLYTEYGFGRKRLAKAEAEIYQHFADLDTYGTDCYMTKINQDFERIGFKPRY